MRLHQLVGAVVVCLLLATMARASSTGGGPDEPDCAAYKISSSEMSFATPGCSIGGTVNEDVPATWFFPGQIVSTTRYELALHNPFNGASLPVSSSLNPKTKTYHSIPIPGSTLDVIGGPYLVVQMWATPSGSARVLVAQSELFKVKTQHTPLMTVQLPLPKEGQTLEMRSCDKGGCAMNIAYRESSHAAIYRKEMLHQACLSAGSVITKIALRLSSLPTEPFWSRTTEVRGLSIRAAHLRPGANITYDRNFDSVTTVAYGPAYRPFANMTVNNFIWFTLSNPITWDGNTDLALNFTRADSWTTDRATGGVFVAGPIEDTAAGTEYRTCTSNPLYCATGFVSSYVPVIKLEVAASNNASCTVPATVPYTQSSLEDERRPFRTPAKRPDNDDPWNHRDRPNVGAIVGGTLGGFFFVFCCCIVLARVLSNSGRSSSPRAAPAPAASAAVSMQPYQPPQAGYTGAPVQQPQAPSYAAVFGSQSQPQHHQHGGHHQPYPQHGHGHTPYGQPQPGYAPAPPQYPSGPSTGPSYSGPYGQQQPPPPPQYASIKPPHAVSVPYAQPQEGVAYGPTGPSEMPGGYGPTGPSAPAEGYGPAGPSAPPPAYPYPYSGPAAPGGPPPAAYGTAPPAYAQAFGGGAPGGPPPYSPP